MTSGESDRGDHNAIGREAYIHDDDSAMTVRQHASRTAEKQAGWFLPHLHAGMSLLDCGCASGSITVGLAEAVAPGRVHGVDISEVEIGRAIARAERQTTGNIRFSVGNVYDLDFADNSFDAVFAHNVLEHMVEPGRALQEMKRVLQPGGVIGLRDFDIGGVIHAPESKLFQRFVDIYEADWEQLGGHPRLARQLPAYLAIAEFEDVIATASFEAYSGAEVHTFMTEVLMGRLSEKAFVGRITQGGMATLDEVDAIMDEFTAWRNLPGAFVGLAHVEVVARKPQGR